MVVPDYALICEIMLVAEGFIEARGLARKFITLYTLCKDLLSKQDHYDWGLRAIKSVLVVAGSLKRGDKGRAEDQVCGEWVVGWNGLKEGWLQRRWFSGRDRRREGGRKGGSRRKIERRSGGRNKKGVGGV